MILAPRSLASRLRPALAAVLVSAGAGFAAPATPAPPPPAAPQPAPVSRSPRMAKTGEYVFNLLPKSLQKNPYMDMTFNTEYTPYGHRLPAASPSRPVYYILHDAGFRQLGWSVAREKPPGAEIMKASLIKALAQNGFLAADPPRHQPDLLINYFWGSHNRPDDETAQDFPELMRKNMIERALLIGGKTLADEINFTILWGAGQRHNVEKMEFLTDQAAENIYYIVASAYDYRAYARKDRQLVWRTTMTAAADGLALDQTMEPLIASGAQFLGRETPEPEIGSRHILRESKVEIGDPILIEAHSAPPSERPSASAQK